MNTVELLLEIGLEEVPARFLPEAERNLREMTAKRLAELDLSCESVRVFSTPRRLTLVVDGLAAGQPDREVEKTGPSKKAAYDEQGKPTKAALGFAKGQGVEVEDLQIFTTDKGEYLGVRKTIAGKPAAELLPGALTEILAALPWPKSMRWGEGDVRFVRPIHWLLALLNGQVLNLRLGDAVSDNRTFGHRFLAPDGIAVRDFADYQTKLTAAKVELDPDKRRAAIRTQLRQFAEDLGGKWIVNEELLTHVVYLVEWPAPLLGHFSESYLDLPREVLVTTMSEHQKYFAFEDAPGKLLPVFCVVSNIEAPDPSLVVRGNERVLVARLEDARYYWETDRKKSLDKLAEGLDGMLYHKKIGSYAEKVERVHLLVNWLGAQVAVSDMETVKRAVRLYKADLLSGVVGEFPELQGTMGMYYARLGGEPEDVARAIFEHYLPRFAGDELPQTEAGALLSICDKLDSIVACFGVGLQPTGAGDPYALRRQALGVLHVLQNRGWNAPLADLIRKAMDGVEDKFKADRAELENEILQFFRDRLFHFVRGEGVKSEIADAVLAMRFGRVPETMARLKAVSEFAAREEFEPFAVAFKRAGNIVKDYPEPGEVDPALFEEDAEKALHQAVESVRDRVEKLVGAGDVLGALLTVAEIRPTVDRFFDDVLVMHKKETVRVNRLNLVSSVVRLFAGIADFKRL